MNSSIVIRLERQTNDLPWGFRLQGGSDFPVPLSIQLVNPNTLAYVNGLNAGDQIISINNRNVTNLTHEEAKMEIIRSGNELELTVIKDVVKQPTTQPLSPIKTNHGNQTTNQRQEIRVDNDRSYETAKGTYWQVDDQPHETPEYLRPKVSNFESSTAYNRDPLQREIWRPKAYRDNPEAPSRQVGTAVYHAQYNSPIGLYSDDKVLEAFKTQTAGLIDEIKGNNSSQSPTYQQQKNISYSSEGKISRSFRVLEEDLSSIQGTSQVPKSIFEQRRQQR